MTDLSVFLNELDAYQPLQKYHFGHTPLQMSAFKTTQQQGCETYEFYHQVLQLRSLRDTLEELQIQKDELSMDLKHCSRTWPFWSYSSRRRRIPRLKFQLKKLESSLAEKTREAHFHFSLLKTKYKHLENLSENDILAKDTDYWIHRLRKQIMVARLSRQVGVGEGELSAVLALPAHEQKMVLEVLEVEEKKYLGEA